MLRAELIVWELVAAKATYVSGLIQVYWCWYFGPEDASVAYTDHKGALLTALRTVASSNRAALKRLKEGHSLRQTLEKLRHPAQFEKEKAFTAQLKETGVMRKCSVSNISFLSTAEALQVETVHSHWAWSEWTLFLCMIVTAAITWLWQPRI